MGYLDYLQHGTKMLSKKGAMPVYMVYFITDACNAKCKHCLLADGAHPGWETPTMEFKQAGALARGDRQDHGEHGQEPDVPAADRRRAVPAQGHRRDRQDLLQEHRRPERRHPDQRQHHGAHAQDRRGRAEVVSRPRLRHRRLARRRRRRCTTRSASSRASSSARSRPTRRAQEALEALPEAQRQRRDHGVVAQRQAPASRTTPGSARSSTSTTSSRCSPAAARRSRSRSSSTSSSTRSTPTRWSRT